MKAAVNDLSRVEWFLRYVVLWGANDIHVEMDNKQITGIRFGFPGGATGEVIMRDQAPPPGGLQIVRGKEPPAQVARTLELEHLCERCHKRMATMMFDCSPVCLRCRVVLEKRLEQHG